ncbi:MAG: T9SS type A sorting domain-containing protein [Bacteroidetes bacterium]|nr:T9SS type A sorting domain-containing protein [Bacteroidota bacterium]
MIKKFTMLILAMVMISPFQAQDGLNQVIIVNGGQFGNPSQRCNIASFDPVSMNYTVFDTIPVNSVQDLIVTGDTAYVAAQDFVVMYDLDSYSRLAIDTFPGASAHQLEVYGDYLLATNYFGQTSDNLYVFDRRTLTLIDTIQEITHPGGTMAIHDDMLYVSQNLKGNIDACPPWGCLNDTLGFLSVVNLNSMEWVEDISLDNNGNECGRILNLDGTLISLNEASGSVTAYRTDLDISSTNDLPGSISTIRYRTESEVIDGQVVSLFNGGIGILSGDITSVTPLVDTPVIAFSYDLVSGQFFATGSDFFSYTNGYAFNSNGEHLYNFPVGHAPEGIAVHYNDQPVGTSFETESMDTILIDVNDFASDPDGDNMLASRIENAPINGILTIQPNGSLQYISLSPGSADAFRVEVCDDKLNPLCSFINVTITPALGLDDALLKSISAYPNPVIDRVYLAGETQGIKTNLYNSLGMEVKHKMSGNSVDMSGLPGGAYFLRLGKGTALKVIPLQKF